MASRILFAVIFVTGFLYIRPAAAAADEAGLDESFDSDGVSIHFVVSGPKDAEAVVLIHGFAGNIAAQWTPIIGVLQTDYRVIALDCRGHGASGKPHDPKKYGVEMANDVARLLDHLKIEKAHVVGYSMGSVIALNFAVHYPQRLRTLTLGGSGGLNRSRIALAVELADSLEKGNGLGPIILALSPKDQTPTPEMIRQIDALVLSMNDAKALAAAARGSASMETGLHLSDEQIEGIHVPTLSLVGANDPVRGDVDELHKLLPKAKYVVIENSDHMIAWTRPEFLISLRQFLNENRRPPSK